MGNFGWAIFLFIFFAMMRFGDRRAAQRQISLLYLRFRSQGEPQDFFSQI